MKGKHILVSLLVVAILMLCSTLVVSEWGGSHNITLITPTNNTWSNSTIMNFGFNISGNLTATNYSCTLYHSIAQAYGASTNTNATVINGTRTYLRETGIADNATGLLWNVGCTTEHNSTTVWARDNFTIFVDTTDPVVTIVNPISASWDNDGNVTFTINVTEANPNSCILQSNLWIPETSANNSANKSHDVRTYTNHVNLDFNFGNNTIWQENITGDYNWTVECNDSAANIANPANISFYVDIVAPSVPTLFSPWNYTKSTDYTPILQWLNSTDNNWSNYIIQVDNDSDFSSPEFYSNTTGHINETTVDTGNLSGDFDYFWMVESFDLAGNYNQSNDTTSWFEYRTDSTCRTLVADQWNICAMVRNASINASTLCTETSCSYISMYNDSHQFQTYTSGASTHAGMNFQSLSSTTPNSTGVAFIYVETNQTWENRTWEIDAADHQFNLTNYSNGWNIVPIVNQSGIWLWELDYSINGDGTAVNWTNITQFMSFRNESASAGSKYIPYVRNLTINNLTIIDYGEAVWIHLNKTHANGEYIWNASGEI